jgi:hypothetical protein
MYDFWRVKQFTQRGRCQASDASKHLWCGAHRFEQQLAGLTDPSEPSHKQHLEYLFMGENPALPNELQLVVEDGPRTAAEYGALGMDHAVCVSNSICIAEKNRLMGALEVKPADASVGKVTCACRTLQYVCWTLQ